MSPLAPPPERIRPSDLPQSMRMVEPPTVAPGDTMTPLASSSACLNSFQYAVNLEVEVVEMTTLSYPTINSTMNKPKDSKLVAITSLSTVMPKRRRVAPDKLAELKMSYQQSAAELKENAVAWAAELADRKIWDGATADGIQ